jgi:hypothetical protein
LGTAIQFELPDIEVSRKLNDADVGIDVSAKIIDPFKFIRAQNGVRLHIIGKIDDVLTIFSNGSDKSRYQIIPVYTQVVSTGTYPESFRIIDLTKLLDEVFHFRFIIIHIEGSKIAHLQFMKILEVNIPEPIPLWHSGYLDLVFIQEVV